MQVGHRVSGSVLDHNAIAVALLNRLAAQYDAGAARCKVDVRHCRWRPHLRYAVGRGSRWSGQKDRTSSPPTAVSSSDSSPPVKDFHHADLDVAIAGAGVTVWRLHCWRR